MRRQLYGIVIAAVLAVGCGSGQTALNPLAPSSFSAVESGSGGRVTTRQVGIQCSDAPVQWVTTNFSPEGRSARIVWLPAPAVQTYQVEVRHNRNGETPTFVYSFFTNRTEASIDDREDGGRYYVRVRVKNPCDVLGAWSETLIIYIDGSADTGKAVTEKPSDDDEDSDSDEEPPVEDCEEDDNNGHGNDCDHDDNSNPS